MEEKLNTSQYGGFSFLGLLSCFSQKKSVAGALAGHEFQHLKYWQITKFWKVVLYPRWQQHWGGAGSALVQSIWSCPMLDTVPVAPGAPPQPTAEPVKKYLKKLTQQS